MVHKEIKDHKVLLVLVLQVLQVYQVPLALKVQLALEQLA